MKFWQSFSAKKRVVLLTSLITLLITVALLWILFREPEKRLPDIPLFGVTGEWADSVFQTLSPAAKIEMLLLTPYHPSISTAEKRPMPFVSGGSLLSADSLHVYRGFLSKTEQQPAPAFHWLPFPDLIPEYAFPLSSDQLLTVSDDSLLLQFFEHHLTVVQSTGSTIAHYPLWKSMPHTPERPDTFYLHRQARLFKSFCQISLSRGIIPAIAEPDYLKTPRRLTAAHDSLMFSYFRILIDSTVPILTTHSRNMPRGATTFRQFLGDQFGFKGLVLLTDSIDDHNTFYRNLEQGIDLQVCAASVETLVQRASEQYQRDKQTRKILDATVMRVLLYREWLRNRSKEGLPAPLQPHALRKLIVEITDRSLVLIHDQQGVVPLNATAPVCLHLPAGIDFSTFSSIVDLFAPTEVREYKPNRRLLSKAGAVQVVIAVNGQLPVYEGWQQAADKGQMMLVHFGSPDSLSRLEATGLAVIQAGDTTADSQAAAANALYGGLLCRGIIPRDLSGTLRGGTQSAPGALVRVQHTIPESAGFTGSFLINIDSIIREAISNGAFPGCQVYIAIRGKVICNNAYGATAWEQGVPVKTSHLYDLASITKVASTTLAFMKMQETGKMRIGDPLGKYFKHHGNHVHPSGILSKKVTGSPRTIFGVTMHELLIHKSGLPVSFPITGYTGGFQNGRGGRTTNYFSAVRIKDSADIRVADNMYLYRWAFDTLWGRTLAMVQEPIRKYQYSDANMVLLQQAIDSANNIPINEFMHKEFYAPLGLRHCTFNPAESYPMAQIVPTSLDLRWRRQLLQGTVHDPLAALLGGVAGHAGLFSNAHDLGVIGQMLLNGGTYGGVKFLDSNTVKLFTTRQPGSTRGMGFDMPVAGRGTIATSSPATCYGHTGFTGTCLWIDPENEIVFAFVSNRIHPNPENQKINFFKVRERLHQAIYDEMRFTGIPFTGREELR